MPYTDKERQRSNHRRWHFMHKYGITPEEYAVMFDEQDGCCLICERPRTPLVVDHCHETGKIRGLLCRQCNTGIGQLDDSPKLLIAAFKYLER